MHDHFADWYRPCTAGTEVNLTGDLLTKRWEGVEKIAESSDQDVLDLVRVALGRFGTSAPYLTRFRAAFKEADAAFQMIGNDLELSILAGSTLCWIFNQSSTQADKASLALLSSVSVWKGPEWIAPFVSHADRYLDERLRKLRKQVTVNRPQFPSNKAKPLCDVFVAKLVENQPPQTSESAKQMLDTLLEGLNSLSETSASAIRELERQSELRRQETDVLWWLTARVSRDLNVPFEQLKTAAASVIVGKELADLVSPPGILPAVSILQSIIPSATGKAAGKAIALHTAVGATPTEWRNGVVKDLKIEKVADICPVLAAIKHSLSTDKADGWISVYKKSYGVDPKTSLQPVEIAQEIHRECLLVRLTQKD